VAGRPVTSQRKDKHDRSISPNFFSNDIFTQPEYVDKRKLSASGFSRTEQDRFTTSTQAAYRNQGLVRGTAQGTSVHHEKLEQNSKIIQIAKQA
jgi:hypothetical protein